MRKWITGVSIGALLAIAIAAGSSAYFGGGWPETCLEMNDMVEASPLGSGAVGIYQRAFGDQAEAACQNDHRGDVQGAFAWAFDFTTIQMPSEPDMYGGYIYEDPKLGILFIASEYWNVHFAHPTYCEAIEQKGGVAVINGKIVVLLHDVKCYQNFFIHNKSLSFAVAELKRPQDVRTIEFYSDVYPATSPNPVKMMLQW